MTILDALRWPASSARSGATAIVDGSRTISYHQLDERSDRLARHLRSLGIGRGDVVGISIARSAASIVGALGVMRAGAAYLPIDPAGPSERSAFELRDAGAAAVISAASEPLPRAERGCRSLLLDDDGELIEPNLVADGMIGRCAVAAIEPDDLAYLIYTSGSTGRPKGVEITHRGLANLVAWHQAAFALTPADRASHLCAVGFDAAVWEVWPYLACGATVVVAPDPIAQDAAALRDWFIASDVTIGFCATPMAQELCTLAWPAQLSLRTLLTGADTLRSFPPASLPFALVNNYGPTETTVVATSGRVWPAASADGAPPSIGRAIDNACVRVVADDGAPASAGTVGEIWIGGPGVARGYRNAPERTEERFVDAAFAPGAGRFFRSGDLGYLVERGELHFVGRRDDQLKLRGYRIEPAEIEAALCAHPAIGGAAIVPRAFGTDTRLVGYVTRRSASELPAIADLQAYLAASLPRYMIPAEIIELPLLPRTDRGKIDRAALRARRDVSVGMDESDSLDERTPTERTLAELVGTLLTPAGVRIDDDLVAIGAHSLILTKLVARIRDRFGVELRLGQVFALPTIRALARAIDGAQAQPEALTSTNARRY
jgi:amino acid adenylation domain-containing protein